MANQISEETLDYISTLAKLELSPEERQQAGRDLEQMLDFFDQLNDLDTEGMEPMSHSFPIHNVLRPDQVTNEDQRERMLENAPVRKDAYFVVPRTIGNDEQ